jgi:predicted transposase/invertase (TIGR01784 family)
VYSEISDQEQQQLYENIIQHKETAMLAQYIKDKGRQEGRQEGTQKTVIALVRKAGQKGMSEEMIAQFVDLDVNLVRQILNNEPVEIPLHLLSDS